MKVFEVMKAADASKQGFRFPCIVSPKVDGFRGYIMGGKLYARSGKRPANRATLRFFDHSALENLDGELCVGMPNAKDVFRLTTMGLRREDGEPCATLYVFDCIDMSAGFTQRLKMVDAKLAALPAQFKGRVVKLPQVVVRDEEELLAFEARCLSEGYEGIMLRSPNGPYKQGRSTANEGSLLKLKRFSDAEAIVIGVEEEVEGGTQRRKGSLGALVCRDIKTGVQFNIGTGFTAQQRQQYWKAKLTGEIAKYKFFSVGMKTAPRHPTFIGFRAAVDL